MTGYRNYARLLPLLLTLLLLVVALTSCGSGTSPSSGSEDSSSSGADSDLLAAVSLDDFKEAASSYGTVTDMTDQLVFETASVQSDRVNIIYMKTHTQQQAENMISGSGGENTVTVLRSGQNYSYCEENAPADASDGTEAFYGYYLRVDNVLLLVTGKPEDRELVRETAADLLDSLGYPAG